MHQTAENHLSSTGCDNKTFRRGLAL